MKAIYKRELRSYFTSPIGYVFVAVYLVLSGVLFAYTTLLSAISGGSADIGNLFYRADMRLFVFAAAADHASVRR